jgi:transcription termination factor Rho
MAGRADAEAPRGHRLNSLPPVNKSELESKHLSELHALAAEAGIERYRMLPRGELVEKLAGGGAQTKSKPATEDESKPRQERGGEPSRRRRRSRGDRSRQGGDKSSRGGGNIKREPRGRERAPEPRDEPEGKPKPEPSIAPATTPASGTTLPPAGRPKRKRRRRWGRRSKGIRVHDLLLPAASGRQAIVYAESRAGCTALLRSLAAELADASNGPDPIALLVDPTPEELADWRREAPKAEIVAAGQARHADDAIAQATARANGGEDVIVLIDSLSRFAESYGDAEGAKSLFDAGSGAAGTGSLTVVAAVERQS